MTDKWLNRLRATAVNNESREVHTQLYAILDFYNKTATGTAGLAPIDWETYAASMHTPDVVYKIKAKYDAFMAAEYSPEGAIGKLGTRT